MIGLALHCLARVVDRARAAAAPLGWVWTYARPSREALREEASYWRQRARETEAALDRLTAEVALLTGQLGVAGHHARHWQDRCDTARAEREEWQRRAVAAVRDLAAAHRACEDDLARAEETGQIARLDLPILRAEAWDRLLRLAGVDP